MVAPDPSRPPLTSPPSPPLSTRLESARLVLRPPRPGDVPELRAHLRRSAAHLRPWTPAPRPGDDPASLTALSKLVLTQRREWKTGLAYSFLLFVRGDDARVVGRVRLGAVARGVFQNTYLGYEIDVDEAGKGYATEGVGAALDFAFGVLELHRVQAAVMPANVRSLRVVEKNGFRREGFAERYLCIANRWEDHVLLARTADEWAPSRAASPSRA